MLRPILQEEYDPVNQCKILKSRFILQKNLNFLSLLFIKTHPISTRGILQSNSASGETGASDFRAASLYGFRGQPLSQFVRQNYLQQCDQPLPKDFTRRQVNHRVAHKVQQKQNSRQFPTNANWLCGSVDFQEKYGVFEYEEGRHTNEETGADYEQGEGDFAARVFRGLTSATGWDWLLGFSVTFGGAPAERQSSRGVLRVVLHS